MKKIYPEIIFNQKENKAQGVLMEEKIPDYIPEMIGLTKVQLFFFVLFTIFLGGTTFGLGTYLNRNSLQKAKKEEATYKKILFENINEQEKETFILFGSFIEPEQAKALQNKIELATGKTCLLVQKPNSINVILGPFHSKEIAYNEMNLIKFRTQVSGSLIHAI